MVFSAFENILLTSRLACRRVVNVRCTGNNDLGHLRTTQEKKNRDQHCCGDSDDGKLVCEPIETVEERYRDEEDAQDHPSDDGEHGRLQSASNVEENARVTCVAFIVRERLR